MKFITIVLALVLSSCSLFKKEKIEYPFSQKHELHTNDYMGHLERLADIYLENNKGRYVEIKGSRRYINSLAERLIKNNENLLRPITNTRLYIVRDKLPFYFSAPGMKIFISSGLINKHIKNEDLFLSLFVSEFTKSNLGLYKKRRLLPLRRTSIEDLLSLSRLGIESKRKLNNLTYEILRRSGFDPESKLMWLQIQNRNSIEFTKQYENPNIISKEEFYLKNYMVSQSKSNEILFEKNSSPEFYRFKKYVERIK